MDSELQIGEVARRAGVSIDTLRYYERPKLLPRPRRSSGGFRLFAAEHIERVLAAARDAGAVVISPRPGQSVEPTAERPQEHWWPALPWRTEAQNPIVAHYGD